jgi:antitoxin VapB
MDSPDPATEKLAREIADLTGEPVHDVVRTALRARLDQLRGRTPLRAGRLTASEILAIGYRCAALPDRDLRSPEDIVGYDDRGLWTR